MFKELERRCGERALSGPVQRGGRDNNALLLFLTCCVWLSSVKCDLKICLSGINCDGNYSLPIYIQHKMLNIKCMMMTPAR